MKITKRLLFVPLLLLTLSAGAFDLQLVRTPSAADDAKAKLFEPDPAVARLYVYRENGFFGRNAKSNLVIGGRIAATTGAGQFAVVSLSSGTYDLECVASGGGNAVATLIHNRKKAALPMTVEAGQLYFVQETFKGAGGFTLVEMKPETAGPIIRKGRLAQDVQWK